MTPTVDYEPVAVAGGANVDSQANFSGSGYQMNGFSSGFAQSKQANKVWRQSSMFAAAIAWFIANVLGINVLDDGNQPALTANFTRAVQLAAYFIVAVAFSATPVFDASQGSTFEITLTGNVTASTCVNLTPGQPLRFIIHQDATGGRSFNWPSNVPGAAIGAASNSTSIQRFLVDGGGTVRPDGPMTIS